MSRCPGCGSVFTLYCDTNQNVWCSNCNSFSTIRVYEADGIETDEVEEEEEKSSRAELELVRGK